MYLHIGEDQVVCTEDILAVLDAKCVSQSQRMLEMLESAKANGRFKEVSAEKANAYVILEKHGETYIYSTPISAGTLDKRSSTLI